MSQDEVSGLLLVAFGSAAILAFMYVFLIRRRVGQYMRQRVRAPSGAMPAVERQGGDTAQLANEAAPRKPLSDAAAAD